MKALVALACSSLVLVQSLSTDYAKERSLRIETTLQVELATTAMEIERDGEPVPGRGGTGDNKTVEVRRVARIDRFLAHEGGVPTKVRRTFDEAEASSTQSFGGQERERALESRLPGTVLELTVSDGEVDVKKIRGDAPSEALDSAQLALALDRLLPAKSVEEGAKWSPDEDDVRAALGLTVLQHGFDRPEPPEGGEGRGGGRGRGGMGNMGAGVAPLLGAADWKATATLTSETVEHGGLECAVIALEIESKGELEEPEPRGFGGRSLDPGTPGAALETTYEVELKGRLLFSAKERRPVLLELEGPVRIETNTEREGRGGTMRIHAVREGTWKQAVEVTQVEEE